jgi:hypothetical protein
MNRQIIILSILTLSFFTASCAKEDPNRQLPPGNVVRISLKAEVPETKVTFDESGQLFWEGGESVALLFGNDNSIGGNDRLTAKLDQGDKKGVFSGDVDLGTFTTDNLRGVVYPYNPDHYYRRNGASYRIVMQVGGARDENKVFHQTQHRNGVLNGENIALFCVLYPEDAIVKDGNYLIDGKKFQWGCSLVRFNIYGQGAKLASDEVFRSLELNANTGGPLICGVQEWKIESSEFIWNGVSNNVILELEEPCTIADKSKENGIIIYMSLLSRNITLKQGTKVTIHTDKSNYSFELAKDIPFDMSAPGKIKKVSIDMSKFVTNELTEYSADGGATWSRKIPETFSTLMVRDSVQLSGLSKIADAIKLQSAPVTLDMSAALFESDTFPATFAGQTKSSIGGSADAAVVTDAGVQISTIKFPGNIKNIAEGAFRGCSTLTQVDLTGITTISPYAFSATGLTSVIVPESVTTCGAYSFSYCPDLATIVFNSPSETNHVFSWRGAPDNENNTIAKPQTVTFGAGVNLGSGQCFDTNHKLVKIIFIGDPATMGSAWIIRCRNLSTIDLTACTNTVASSSAANLGNVGDTVPDGTPKVIFVPTGKKADFSAINPWKYLSANKGFLIKEPGE